jgi:hypothetical protein
MGDTIDDCIADRIAVQDPFENLPGALDKRRELELF